MTTLTPIISTLLVLVLLCSAPASAQDAVQGASNAAAAEALYNQAKARLKSGETAKACSLLEESQRLDRADGTTLLLAHCYEALGRTASAWALFREVQSASPDSTQRQRIARIRASALEPHLATLVIEGTGAEKLRAIDAQVSRDSVLVPLSVLGVAVPVDPGRHTVSVSSANTESWSTTVEVVPGSLTRVVIPTLLPKRFALTNPVSVRTTQVHNPPLDVALEPQPSTSRTVPWLLTGFGAASVLAGVTLSITAHNEYARSDAHCRTRTLCDASGLEIRARAETQADWATGLSIAGAASLAAAGLLFVFTTGPNTAWYVQPTATPQTMSLSLGGTL